MCVNVVRCQVEGCLDIYSTSEPVFPSVRFTCRHHPRKVQVEASAGRTYDPVRDNTDAAVHFDKHQFQRYDSFKKLREVVEGDEPFMTGGHQSAKARNPERMIPTPEWMFDRVAVAAFIEKLFPHRWSNNTQRLRAGAYEKVIELFFLAKKPDSAVEEEANLNLGSCSVIVQEIRRAAEGRRRDGRPRSFGRQGRPRKQLEAQPETQALTEQTI